MSGFGRTSHENVVKPYRALGRCYPVDGIAVWPERYGGVANRNRVRYPASQHHGCSTEAGGKAVQAAAGGKATEATAGGEATEAAAGGEHSCISPAANHSNTIACARFSISEACRA